MPDAVRDGFAAVAGRARRPPRPAARIEGVLVAKQLKGGVECILGIHRDPVFGPMAMFGLGGIFVEVMKDVVFRRCPFGADVAEAMIRSIKGAPLLLGARGRPPADVKALAEMLSRLSAFAVAAGPTAAVDRPEPGVRDAGRAGGVRGRCGDRGESGQSALRLGSRRVAVMARASRIGANMSAGGPDILPVSWPGLARPPTTCGAEPTKVVDGRTASGHETTATAAAGAAKLAPMRTSRAMTLERLWHG